MFLKIGKVYHREFDAQKKVGWVEELLVCLSLEFKQYLGRRLFQTVTSFSLFICPSI